MLNRGPLIDCRRARSSSSTPSTASRLRTCVKFKRALLDPLHPPAPAAGRMQRTAAPNSAKHAWAMSPTTAKRLLILRRRCCVGESPDTITEFALGEPPQIISKDSLAQNHPLWDIWKEKIGEKRRKATIFFGTVCRNSSIFCCCWKIWRN